MTIQTAVPLLQIEPEGRPAALVGIFTIDKLFTNVAQLLFAVILVPTIIASA